MTPTLGHNVGGFMAPNFNGGHPQTLNQLFGGLKTPNMWPKVGSHGPNFA